MTDILTKTRFERLPGRWIRKIRRRYSDACVNIVNYHSVRAERSVLDGAMTPHHPAEFERQIDFLTAHHNIISLEALFESIVRNNVPSRAAVLTFDDGYADTLRRVKPMLYRRRIPMTVFLTTSVVGNRDLLWQHKLAWLLANGHEVRVEQALRSDGYLKRESAESLTNFARRCYRADLPSIMEAVLQSVGENGPRLASRLRPYVEAEEVASADPEFVAFGNHTHSHPVLAALTYEQQLREIQTARDEILSLTGRCPSALAYPFGQKRHFDAQTKRIAQETWHRGALDMRRQANVGPLDPFELSRMPAPTGSQRLFQQMIENLSVSHSTSRSEQEFAAD